MPADPALIETRADRLYDFAVSVTGCQTPWIALNELFGAQTPTPWTTTTAQYRANTLALVRRLKERGAFPPSRSRTRPTRAARRRSGGATWPRRRS